MVFRRLIDLTMFKSCIFFIGDVGALKHFISLKGINLISYRSDFKLEFLDYIKSRIKTQNSHRVQVLQI